jgi:4-hydroxyphenylpyruvate dioxygenase
VKRCIATVSLSGTLEDKLKAVAAVGFDGVEIFENDLVNSRATPRQIHQLATDLGRSATSALRTRRWPGADTCAPTARRGT